jgi:hypothetical protein
MALSLNISIGKDPFKRLLLKSIEIGSLAYFPIL